MNTFRFGLMLAALSCAEPTASYQRPAEPSIAAQRRENNSYSISPVNRTVYVRVASARNAGGEPIHAFMQRMFESADSAGARRLVLDLRSVSGSDGFLLVPLLKGVITRDRFLERGALSVVVGRDSFSPRQNAATLLQQYAKPVFVQ